MGIFGHLFKKPKSEPTPQQYICKFSISSNTIPPKPGYDQLDANEQLFFAEFQRALEAAGISPISIELTRLANGVFNVRHYSCYVGKVKVKERSRSGFYMQYFGPRGAAKELRTESLKECIDTIPAWIQHIQRSMRSRKRAMHI